MAWFDWIPFGSRLDKKSPREIEEDRQFLEALSKIKTLRCRDGCISMGIEDLKDVVIASRKQNAKLVK